MTVSATALSPNALRVLEARYLRRDEKRQVAETPDELFDRVASAVAETEGRGAADWKERFRAAMASLEFLPNSPTLMNAGAPLGQLSACFVLPVEDTMEGIFGAVREMALVQRTGGGTGFSFSRLRRKGGRVASTGGQASGPVSFMRIFDCATENIRQGGRRRGANMGILRVDHPDILEFIAAKKGSSALRSFNLSVSVTDAFMESALADRPYELLDPRSSRPAGRLSAREVFEEIVTAAWETGDPGLLFLDSIGRANPTPRLGAIEATNPCGEVPLLPYEACTLGSINLARMTLGGAVDWEKLRETTRLAVRFLDDVVEVSRYPLPEIDRMARGNRKIGLGVMGFAELLLRLSISYDSDRAAELAGEILRAISRSSLEASQALAEDRGVFPNWEGSVFESRGLRVRNATRTAIAPTGTISIIAGTTAGIEPLFALAYRRRALDGQILVETNPIFADVATRLAPDPEWLAREVARLGGLPGGGSLPEELGRLFVTALDIPPDRHLEIQAAFQRHVDNSVSKTINLRPEATMEAVAHVYQRAWELGLKGITVYRYGSRPGQVLELGAGEEIHEYEHGVRCDHDECKF